MTSRCCIAGLLLLYLIIILKSLMFISFDSGAGFLLEIIIVLVFACAGTPLDAPTLDMVLVSGFSAPSF